MQWSPEAGNVGEVEEITAVDLSAESGVIYSENGAFENWTIVSGNGSTETGETANRVYRTTAETNGALILSDRSWKNVSVSADIKSCGMGCAFIGFGRLCRGIYTVSRCG